MPVLGITGGVATGKSTFVQALLRRWPATLFDADQCARELLASDEPTRLAVRRDFGDEVFDKTGAPDRVRLRELIFRTEGDRQRLEAILHPAIRARWMALASQYRHARGWLFVDIPLLFETGAETQFDEIAVVACTAATQLRRLSEERKLDLEMSEKIVGAQLALETKIAKASHVIWNESSVSCLDRQSELLTKLLRDSAAPLEGVPLMK